METYTVFVRNWWKHNSSYPDGLEPDGAAEKEILDTGLSLEEARAMCREYNDTHDPGKLSRKAEFMEE